MIGIQTRLIAERKHLLFLFVWAFMASVIWAHLIKYVAISNVNEIIAYSLSASIGLTFGTWLIKK
jgi:hypothetical protein